MVPEAIAANPAYTEIQDAHISVAKRAGKTAYVHGISGYSSDAMHYNNRPGPQKIGFKMADSAIKDAWRKPASPADTPAAYTFASDTIGSTPAGITAKLGTPVIATVDGHSEKFLTSTTTSVADSYVYVFNRLYKDKDDQTVTFKRVATSTSIRDGLILRPQAGVQSSVFPSANAGYFFQISTATGQLRIYLLTNSASTQLAVLDVANLNNYVNFECSVIGSVLTFKAAKLDGTIKTVTANDLTYSYSSGQVQYVNGSSQPGQTSAFITNVELH